VAQRGHAIECRVNAEDPARGFAPSSGRILFADFPSGPGVRVDAGVATGDRVSPHYDSLVAKIVVHAPDRPAALQAISSALGRTALLGIESNLPYLKAIVTHPVFRKGEATTTFTTRELGSWRPRQTASIDDVLVAAAMAEVLRARDATRATSAVPDDDEVERHGPWSRGDGFRVGGA
jgi:acetyl/propionyl-CoA carboxylase alpha subunit